MSLKKNFYEALGELIGKETPADSGPETEQGQVQPAQDEAAPVFQAGDTTAAETQTGGEAASGPAAQEGGAAASRAAWRSPFQRETPPPRKPPEPSFTPPEGFRPVNEVTVISKNTVVLGDIRSLASVTLEGSVRGRVDVMRDATVQGMLVGDLTCKNARLQGSAIQGSVSAKENAQIDHNSTILGDVAAQNAVVDGRIKGSLDISGRAELLQNAIIYGDIRTTTIAIADGANIKGFVSTAFLSENSDDAFPGEVVIDEDELLGIK